MENKYLHVPLEQLTYVRIMVGMEGFSLNADNSLNIGLPSKGTFDARNTIHGTLNGVVSSHIDGNFNNSKFAVIGNLLEMGQRNELISVSPADTYFWGDDKSISVPNPTLVLPDSLKLSESMSSRINIINYPHSDDESTNFNNMRNRIQQYFESQNLPFHAIDKRGWAGLGFDRLGVDNGQGERSLSNALGYRVGGGLHDGTGYSDLESCLADINRLNNEISKLETRSDFESANNIRDAGGDPTIGNELGTLAQVYANGLAKLPHHHQEFFKSSVGGRLQETADAFRAKIDNWFSLEEPAPLTVKSPSMPPIPPMTSTPPPPPPHTPFNTSFDDYVAAYKGSNPTGAFSLNTLISRENTLCSLSSVKNRFSTACSHLDSVGLPSELDPSRLLEKIEAEPQFAAVFKSNTSEWENINGLRVDMDGLAKQSDDLMKSILTDLTANNISKSNNPKSSSGIISELKEMIHFQKQTTDTFTRFNAVSNALNSKCGQKNNEAAPSI